MRDYNYRKRTKVKEQVNRKTLYNDRGYWPSMPSKGIGENSKEYYVEGHTGTYKKFLKRQASKAVRKARIDSVNSGCHYRKMYELLWQWYWWFCICGGKVDTLAWGASDWKVVRVRIPLDTPIKSIPK